MIKKLQTKFVLLTMSALLVVLLILITGINIANYNSVVKGADNILTFLSKHEGTFPQFHELEPEKSPSKNKNLPKDERLPEEMPPKPMFMELPYETRYFSVLLFKDTGSVLETKLDQIVSIDEETSITYAREVYTKSKTSGFIYRFRYRCQDEGSNLRITFLDQGRSLASVWKIFFISTGFSFLIFAIVTLIVIFLSNRIIKPISETHEKQTKRLTELTNNLVLFTRMEETEKSMQIIEFPISDVVNEAALSFQALAQTQNKTKERPAFFVRPLLSDRFFQKFLHRRIWNRTIRGKSNC